MLILQPPCVFNEPSPTLITICLHMVLEFHNLTYVILLLDFKINLDKYSGPEHVWNFV